MLFLSMQSSNICPFCGVCLGYRYWLRRKCHNKVPSGPKWSILYTSGNRSDLSSSRSLQRQWHRVDTICKWFRKWRRTSYSKCKCCNVIWDNSTEVSPLWSHLGVLIFSCDLQPISSLKQYVSKDIAFEEFTGIFKFSFILWISFLFFPSFELYFYSFTSWIRMVT